MRFGQLYIYTWTLIVANDPSCASKALARFDTL